MNIKQLIGIVMVLSFTGGYGQDMPPYLFPSGLSDSLDTEKYAKPKTSFWDKEVVKIGFVPTLFFGATAATWNSREAIREQRNRFIPTFKYHFDDYMQYAPAAVTFGLKASGVKGRNEFKRSAITYATSVAIMAILVNGIKYTAKVERPDGSSRNSFPSGHTANAFTNAAFLDREYGLVNPAYSIGGYGVATMTAVGRGLNNRHWVSDVFAGAGIGILSSQLAYFFVDKIYGNKGDNLSLLSQLESNENPSFLAIKMGSVAALESIVEDEEDETLARLGWEAGLEGAYFFTKNWGVGGQFAVAGFPFNKSRVSIPVNPDTPEYANNADIITESLGFLNIGVGPYYAVHFSDRWNLMFKGLVGYSIAAQGHLKLKYDSPNQSLEESQALIMASYKPKNAIQFTAGTALTYTFASSLGATFYADFNHSQLKYNYSIHPDFLDPGDPQAFTDRSPFNYMTVGIRLTAYF
ncbi:phosphatase PAP2 family protein [Myroides sp. NP-2]|uniref:phosphatase PAP2 family protein n=1 Tax=Myroides sp. NP-2 TaxID=2759945 RepID=UPI0021021B88|nr:phosphatase PAP2 family protein [Myroides sp. NP-2]